MTVVKELEILDDSQVITDKELVPNVVYNYGVCAVEFVKLRKLQKYVEKLPEVMKGKKAK